MQLEERMATAVNLQTDAQQALDDASVSRDSRSRALPDTPRGDHYRQPATAQRSHESLANFLGWFSVGLGVAELIAPAQMARLIGVRDTRRNRATLQSMGARELMTGLGILSNNRSANWMWSRVAGDAIDLSLLGGALNSEHSNRGRAAAASAAVLGVTALDIYCASQLSREEEEEGGVPASRRLNGSGDRIVADRGTERLPANKGVRRAWHSVTVNKPIAEVYEFWRELENLPRFMQHLESVEIIDNTRSHWKAKAPAGTSVEWDAEIVEEKENELISWRSMPDSVVPNAGTVRFKSAPGGRGTEVHVVMEYEIPGGSLGSTVAKLFREEPSQQVRDDLRHFKQVLETGEIVKSDASIHTGMHAARPSRR
jgi:uncharacterized membrane protein